MGASSACLGNYVQQGKVVAERAISGWLVMLPDGVVQHCKSKAMVERLAKRWFAENLAPDSIGIGSIEWRDA